MGHHHIKGSLEEDHRGTAQLIRSSALHPSGAAPIVLAKKKKTRETIALMKRKDSFPFPPPRIDDVLDLLHMVNNVSPSQDLASGNWQIEIEEPSKEKLHSSWRTTCTRIVSHFAFWLTNAPEQLPTADELCPTEKRNWQNLLGLPGRYCCE
ncbi:hypothetical protein OUZ56_033810 [Daphnia magna]|uniref:Uncharacterized protein n=1 Tax=Daphnia magna TaxID=35525 RepID=A0ABR0BB56_9CRUS|nr:hypothetical protein OUZ56_033810 [Daphnia magna]